MIDFFRKDNDFWHEFWRLENEKDKLIFLNHRVEVSFGFDVITTQMRQLFTFQSTQLKQKLYA